MRKGIILVGGSGTSASLLDAANYIHVIEERQGLKIACPEEIALFMGFNTAEELLVLAKPLQKSGYGQYLTDIVNTGLHS